MSDHYEDEDDDDDDDGITDEEGLAEMEAMLYSKIHHEENPIIHDNEEDPKNPSDDIKAQKDEQIDSGLCSMKGSEPSSPDPSDSNDLEDESRISAVEKLRNKDVITLDASSSSDDDEEDDGIKIVSSREVVVIDSDSDSSIVELFDNSLKPRKEQKLLVSQNTQKKAVDSYVVGFESSDSSDSEVSDSVIQDELSINVSQTSKLDDKNILKEILETERNDAIVECKFWSPDMNRFYNQVNVQNFNLNLETILESMPDGEKNWHIDPSDRNYFFEKRRNSTSRYFNGRRQKCLNCNEFGHLARNCREPRKLIRCSMCGRENHWETRCPEQMCLRCGQPGVLYMSGCFHCRKLDNFDCYLCGGVGHVISRCPDLWRRYHATTAPGGLPEEPAQDPHKDLYSIWCCNCAKRGHYLHNCTAYAYSPYPYSVLKVISYGKGGENSPDASSTPREKRFKKKEMKVFRRERRLEESPKSEHLNVEALDNNSSRENWRRKRKEKKKLKKVLNSMETGEVKNRNNKKKQNRSEFREQRGFGAAAKQQSNENSPSTSNSSTGKSILSNPGTTIKTALRTLIVEASYNHDLSKKRRRKIWQEVKRLKKCGIPNHIALDDEERKRLTQLF